MSWELNLSSLLLDIFDAYYVAQLNANFQDFEKLIIMG